MRWFRQLVFYAFVGLYAVLCPLMIFSTLGYVFVPGAEQQIVKTGLIYVSSAPSGASIYLGQRRYTKRTPAVLQGLRPGLYDVRLMLKGHQAWTRQVAVEPERATVLQHALLLPQPLRPTEFSSGAFDELLPLADTSLLLLSAGPRLGGLMLYDVKERRGRPLLPMDSPWVDARLLAATSASDSPALLLHVATKSGEQRLWVELARHEPEIEDVTGLLPAGASRLAWGPAEPRFLFVLKAGLVQGWDRAGGPPLRVWGRAVGMQLAHNALYILDENGAVQRFSPDGRLVTERFAQVLPEHPSGLIQLEVLPKGDVVLVSKRGELVSSRAVLPPVERGVRGLAVMPKRERVLFWTRDQLGMLQPDDVEEWNHAPPPLRVQWLLTEGRDLAQGFWVYDGSHCLVRDGDRVLLFALETDGPIQPHELLQVQAGSSIAYDDASGMLYYLDRDSGRLRALELLPQQEVLPLPDWISERTRTTREAP